MIRSLCGEALSMTETSVILDVNGLGFDILCSRGALALCSPGERARLTTYLQVSEAGAFLFGFADETERELFLKITAIKGIGGRTAMTILGVLSAEEVIHAAARADVATFTRVPGVGRKTAERICFELKNVVPPTPRSAAPPSRTADTVADALRTLGFTQADAAGALGVVRAALGEGFDQLDEERLLKAALKELQRK
ncbi:MAG: Holliday junction branch migration protein RuvA [Synergistaceae bacterium]|jgi:Holliday junction DNA helicase RuvA|nr:Holliday junction branch migration protein RuvA [Synergistaceae bacterium]